MGRFIFRRILGLIPTMFLIITLSFFLIRLAPGGPFSSEKKVTPEVMQNLLKKYHMDEPLFKQYLRYMGDVLRGELGPSFKNKDYSVNELIAVSLPNSLILGVTSLALALLFGIAVGVVSALNQNSAADYTAMSAAVIGISVPLFVVGPVFMLVFAMKLQWLPTSGWITGRAGLKTLIMPAVTLAFPYFAYIARLSRASILEILRSDYIRTARAKGLKQSAVIWRHVLKGAYRFSCCCRNIFGARLGKLFCKIGFKQRLYAHYGNRYRILVYFNRHEFNRRHHIRPFGSAHFV